MTTKLLERLKSEFLLSSRNDLRTMQNRPSRGVITFEGTNETLSSRILTSLFSSWPEDVTLVLESWNEVETSTAAVSRTSLQHLMGWTIIDEFVFPCSRKMWAWLFCGKMFMLLLNWFTCYRLNQINSSWSWHIDLFIYCWIWFN